MFSETSGPSRGKERAAQKVATRARILEVARTELEAKGYEATNIRAIARAANVAPGTVLLHFQDKQDLLHAALFEDLERAWVAAQASARRASIEDDLVALAQTFFDYYAERPALSRSLLRESMFAEEPWRSRFAAQIAGVHAWIVQLTAEAVTRGELREETDGSLLAVAFLSFYYFALIAWVQGGHPAPVRMLQSALRQHLGGLRPAHQEPSHD
ncbi:MAG: TetR/AcrR family transcriptional regulator [Fimbriimonas sp.]